MLRRLRLSNFRCFDKLDCSLEGGITLFVGENAQGKTSILEAVCVLLRLQSPRTNALGEQIQFGEEGFFVEGDFSGRKLLFSICGSKRRMQVEENLCRSRRDYLAETGLVVWIGNDDIELVRGGSETRRRYLDFGASQVNVGYRSALRSYARALRARNFLLKRDSSPRWDQIAAYTKLLVEHGSFIAERRADLISTLNMPAEKAQCQVSGKDELLTLKYKRSGGVDLATAFKQSIEADGRRRLTLVGPHRDDLLLEVNSLPAAQFASEGQQRTIALALKLAQAAVLRDAKGVDPILLIDDIFGELDQSRRNALLSHLPVTAQKLITTTSLDWAAEEYLKTAQNYVLKRRSLELR